ncbi:hypothetical protein D2E76_16260 [Mycobacteroides abscessus]|uniref:Uncharacterized protein n=1 Tax=Mycobacteroides abscessus TaxID=36809 RepID=A0ABD7HM81_9MYCO|nr:hypothetical protein [Mycobacteroides abscessus]RIT36805.1 hypothetical protein D2E76_16260 [Mycobacteroides abscessus]
MIWVPLAGGGPHNGYRYRDTLRPLSNEDLTESHADALARIEAFAHDRTADLQEWRGHSAALSVYVQWAVYGLLARDLITRSESLRRFERLALLQQKDRLHPGYPGIHYGRPGSWEAPRWWGSDIHKQHQDELIATAPQHYSSEGFKHWAQQRDWRWAR